VIGVIPFDAVDPDVDGARVCGTSRVSPDTGTAGFILPF
jgi:hypothetical protein